MKKKLSPTDAALEEDRCVASSLRDASRAAVVAARATIDTGTYKAVVATTMTVVDDATWPVTVLAIFNGIAAAIRAADAKAGIDFS